MAIVFDEGAIKAAFSIPESDGRFAPGLFEYLKGTSALRRSVILAFAPKAAGTFIRTAAIEATGGQLVRTVHAQGGRDATFYLPTFLLYYVANFPASPLVTHVHMQALPANRHFIEALDLRPAIMIRSIPDMLASYAEMIETDPLLPNHWLNICLPKNYAGLSEEKKGDFIIDMMAPWYASYFASWVDYGAKESRVLILDYDEFRNAPAIALELLLAHSGIPQSRVECETAVARIWKERNQYRYNRATPGRGALRFTSAQIERIARQIDFYPELAGIKHRLITSAVQ